MRTLKLLVLAPFAVALACGGGKKEGLEPSVPSTPDLDAGSLPSMDSGMPSDMTDSGGSTTSTPPTPPPPDTAAAPVDAGPPPVVDAGKPKGGKPKGGKKK